FFFFQAEDGIRDFHVTGVQTCALPISGGLGGAPVQQNEEPRRILSITTITITMGLIGGVLKHLTPHLSDHIVSGAKLIDKPLGRSEERRVGKAGRATRSQMQCIMTSKT